MWRFGVLRAAGFGQFWWHIAQLVLGNWKTRLILFFPLWFLLFFLSPLLRPHCHYLFSSSFFTAKNISSEFILFWDVNLLSYSLCLFFFLSFWSGIPRPVLLSQNRRESSCSRHEQESHRWQNSGNASIFWIDSDWKAGFKHSWDHEDTQVWGSWRGSVWLHSPWVVEIQPHIQVILLSTYFPLIPRNMNIIPKTKIIIVYFTTSFLCAWALHIFHLFILPTNCGSTTTIITILNAEKLKLKFLPHRQGYIVLTSRLALAGMLWNL